MDEFKTVLKEISAAEAMARKRKTVILLDGIDEVAGGYGHLVDLIFGCQYPRVVSELLIRPCRER